MPSALRLIRLSRATLFLVAVFLFVRSQGAALHAMLPLCSDACDPEEGCTVQCIDDSNSSSTCGDYNGGGEYGHCEWGYCGDGICDSLRGEDCSNCSEDCDCITGPVCGNSTCDFGETSATCEADCGAAGSGSGCNGDGVCQHGESQDCPDCQMVGWCNFDTDCPSTNDTSYICDENKCVEQQLPDYTWTCWPGVDDPCPYGGICELAGGDYGEYQGCGSVCFVCVPSWSSRQ